jgi:tetratricopeptide (TPR) repeat protein
MKRFPLAALALAFAAVSGSALAADAKEPTAAPEQSALDAPLFYELLVGEMNARVGEAATGVSLILDAARKTNDPALYQRAVEMAYQARSGDAALQAARAWKQAFPKSREANRYVLQILVALNRLPDTIEPLRAEIALTDASERNAVIASVPRLYSRVADRKAAAAVAEQALSELMQNKETGASAWTAVGRLRLAAGDTAGALDAVRRAQAVNPQAEGPALLALEMVDPKQPEAEALFKQYLAGKPLAELRMAYARVLVDSQRYGEATQQVRAVTAQRPDFAEAWLVQGSLQLQDNQDSAAEASLKHYLELAPAQKSAEERRAGEAQAFLNLSRIAEKRKDYALANAWLDKIQDPQDLVAAQQRRASILARQGKMDEARKLIRGLPEREAGDARIKMLAEVQLLRDNKQYKAAFDVLGKANAKEFDPDLAYDQAMIAEKMGNMGEMERLLRQVIAQKPDYHHAYNALGYSFADRNVRLPEAKELIQKALTYAPDDPYISDSLGWVEFRMGNKAEALRILDTAYKARPDADIAAHLGEVLWSLGQRDRAQSIWKEGLLLNSDNDTLQETLKRLHVKP